MTIDPRQYEQEVLGEDWAEASQPYLSRRKSRSSPLSKKFVRLAWGLTITAGLVLLTRYVPVVTNNFPFVRTNADLLALLLLVLHGAIAIGEDYQDVVSLVAIGGAAVAFAHPQIPMIGVVIAIGSFLNYLFCQPTRRAAAIFACCFALVNLLR